MANLEKIIRISGDRVEFLNLVDVSSLESRPVSLPVPGPFGQLNEFGGLRHVGSLDEVCEIARQAAVETGNLLKTDSLG